MVAGQNFSDYGGGNHVIAERDPADPSAAHEANAFITYPPDLQHPMPKTRRLLGAAILAAACGPDPSALENDAVHALRVDVPARQEAFRAANGRYASHIRELTGGADTLPSGIRVIIHGGDENGWSASSSHRDVPGAACAVYVGNPHRVPSLTGGVSPRQAGQVTCIAFGPWKKRKMIEQSGPYAIAP